MVQICYQCKNSSLRIQIAGKVLKHLSLDLRVLLVSIFFQFDAHQNVLPNRRDALVTRRCNINISRGLDVAKSQELHAQ